MNTHRLFVTLDDLGDVYSRIDALSWSAFETNKNIQLVEVMGNCMTSNHHMFIGVTINELTNNPEKWYSKIGSALAYSKEDLERCLPLGLINAEPHTLSYFEGLIHQHQLQKQKVLGNLGLTIQNLLTAEDLGGIPQKIYVSDDELLRFTQRGERKIEFGYSDCIEAEPYLGKRLSLPFDSSKHFIKKLPDTGFTYTGTFFGKYAAAWIHPDPSNHVWDKLGVSPSDNSIAYISHHRENLVGGTHNFYVNVCGQDKKTVDNPLVINQLAKAFDYARRCL
jgi:hypothetical protein